MAWPRCPECGTADLKVFNRAEQLRGFVTVRMRFAEISLPAEDVVHRSYACPAIGCGWSAITEERVTVTRPQSLYLRRKYADTGEADVPPAVQTGLNPPR